MPLLVDIHLVWRNHLGYGIENPYRLLYARFDGNEWQAEEEVYRTNNSGVQGWAHQTQSGDIRITLLDNSFPLTRAYQLTPTAGGWDISLPIIPAHSVYSVWADQQAGIRFYGGAIYGSTSSHLHYSYWRNNVFEVENFQMPGGIANRNTQLDSQNNLHTFWTSNVPVPGGIVTGLNYQCLQHDMTWRSPQILSGERGVYDSPAKAANANNQIALAWKQTGIASFQLRLWHGCEQQTQQEIPSSDPDRWTLRALGLGNGGQRVCAAFRRTYDHGDYTVVCANISR